jgi:hypothetical protein
VTGGKLKGMNPSHVPGVVGEEGVNRLLRLVLTAEVPDVPSLWVTSVAHIQRGRNRNESSHDV